MISLQQQIFHSEAKSGIESYRWEMWKDAWALFLSSPLTGIGFNRQVVFRLYEGEGTFKPNNMETLKAPPVSGPHNSYLNALTRMGIAGALFWAMHLCMLISLWRSQEKIAFWLVWGQFFYAFLNVALEGPTRSFSLLLFLGMALSANKTRQTHGKSSARSLGALGHEEAGKIVPSCS